MKKITLTAVVATIVFSSCSNGGDGSSSVTLMNNMDSVSYAIGAGQAKGMLGQLSQSPDLSIDAFMKGFNNVVDSADLLLTDEEGKIIVQVWSQKKQMADMAKQQQEQQAMYGNVKAEGEAFLAENATKEGVVTTPSGLQYIVLTPGKGKQPTAASNVTVHYHGTTPDGTVFDSSVDRAEPATFGLNRVIRGWTEGVALMKEGAKYRFFIPQELAYGASPQGGSQGAIKPYMPLVFEVELISVNN